MSKVAGVDALSTCHAERKPQPCSNADASGAASSSAATQRHDSGAGTTVQHQ
jgi:hypothetical protein